MQVTVFWFRRDLRFEDNAGLYQALNSGLPVLPIFLFDRNIIGRLPFDDDSRITFIFDRVGELKAQLEKRGSSLMVLYDDPLNAWKKITREYNVGKVFCNRDYEPYALERDSNISTYLHEEGIEFFEFKDHVVFEMDEVQKEDGSPYTVYTPYSRKWKSLLIDSPDSLKPFPSEAGVGNFLKCEPAPTLQLNDIGFTRSERTFPSSLVSESVITRYDKTRDYPSLDCGTSKLGIHFRFGTISIREKVRMAVKLNEVFLNELIWRDFYSMILFHFPHAASHPFRKKYEQIEWRHNEKEFEAWCEGKTGYPFVDAGMRQLNQTGYMHNRLRMVTASFLTKHLLIDWRLGEQYFADRLLDFDLSSNNGGWQWAAGTGCDAAPYFRIFNPTTQMKKFDPDGAYVKKWVPDFGTEKYPSPIVEHRYARERALETYKRGLSLAQ